MRVDLLELLACPDCGTELHASQVREHFELRGMRHLSSAVLTCGLNHRYPVIDEVPRLVRERDLSETEREHLEDASPPAAREIEPRFVSAEAFERELDRIIESAYDLTPDSSLRAKANAASEIEYLVAEYRGDNKRKYAELVRPLGLPPDRPVVDVGGSLPGMLRALAPVLQPSVGIVVDYNARFADAFKSHDREFTLIRADACALPFRTGSMGFLVSAFLLEHVPRWREALGSMLRLSERSFVAFGPNRWFPFEIGHLDAPLAGTLPRPLARYVAWAWLNGIGRGRTLRRIDEILSEMSYISSRQFRHACRALDAKAHNVFPEMVELVVNDRDRPPSVPRRITQAWPRGSRMAAGALVSVGLEPQMYYVLESGSA